MMSADLVRSADLADVDPATANVVFAGCENRVRVAAYLAALAAEQRVRGLMIGTVAGLALAGAAYLYLRPRAGA